MTSPPSLVVWTSPHQAVIGIIGISVGRAVIKDRFTQSVCEVIAIGAGLTGYLPVDEPCHPSLSVIQVLADSIACAVFSRVHLGHPVHAVIGIGDFPAVGIGAL